MIDTDLHCPACFCHLVRPTFHRFQTKVNALQLALLLSEGYFFPKNLETEAEEWLVNKPDFADAHFMLGMLNFATWQNRSSDILAAEKHLEAAVKGDRRNLYALALLIEVIQTRYAADTLQKERIEALLGTETGSVDSVDLILLRSHAIFRGNPISEAKRDGESLTLKIEDVAHKASTFLSRCLHYRNSEVLSMRGLILLQVNGCSENSDDEDEIVELIDAHPPVHAVSLVANVARLLYENGNVKESLDPQQLGRVLEWLEQALRFASSRHCGMITIVKSVLDKLSGDIREQILQELIRNFGVPLLVGLN